MYNPEYSAHSVELKDPTGIQEASPDGSGGLNEKISALDEFRCTNDLKNDVLSFGRILEVESLSDPTTVSKSPVRSILLQKSWIEDNFENPPDEDADIQENLWHYELLPKAAQILEELIVHHGVPYDNLEQYDLENSSVGWAC